MASRGSQTLVRWSRNTGRNGWDVPTDVPPSQSLESMNILLERNTLGKKRRGSAAQTFTGDTFAGYLGLYRFVPSGGETSAHVFIVSGDGTTKILKVAGGSAAANLTLKDNVASVPQIVRFATLNGKVYLAYDSTVNRLHVYDPNTSTTAIRRAGLATPAAATVADTGAGGYAATLRYYRIQWRVKSGSTIQRQSLVGSSVSFTPIGTGTHARITQPTVANEGETHWAIFGSADGDLYYELAEVAIGTTTYDDNEAPADYDVNNDASESEGASTPFPSVKYLLSTGERLMGFGVWETSAGDSVTPKAGRVYFTPVLDTTDADDDERISNTTAFQGWIDVNRNGGAEDRAIAGPLDGNVFVFQSKGVYMLIPTGNAAAPFRRVVLTQEIGAISPDSTFIGEDEAGRACLYWLDPIRGPYRYGAAGLQYLGHDIADVWATVNLAASTRTAAGVYDPELRACIFGLATGASNTLSEYLVYFVREARPVEGDEMRGGWVRWAEASASAAIAMAMLPETIGVTMSSRVNAYVGDCSNLRRWNDDSATQDGTTSYQGYVTSKDFQVGGLERLARVGRSYLQAAASNALTITQTLTRNFGDETARTATVLLTATGSESRVLRKFEASALADVQTMRVTLGDAAAANTASWTLDEWSAAVEPTDER